MEKCQMACIRCSKKRSMEKLAGQCECGGTLLVEYDLEQIRYNYTQNVQDGRPLNMWRYFDLLPVRQAESIISLGEGGTPLLRLRELEKTLPIRELWIKREEQNPTGSFKARGLSVAISLLHERGIQKVAVPSNGNAASALAAYAARANMEAYVFVPQDCPALIIEECMHYGAHTYQVDGLIHDAGQIIEDGKAEQGWFNVGTLREPGRVEGKKTMGFELLEQFQGNLPDVIVYPTGGGSGIVGMWKAFNEMKALGYMEGDLPRLVSVQEEGCQPIVDAIKQDGSSVQRLDHSVSSSATGMRVPNPPDGDLVVSILRETNGAAIAVTAEEIQTAKITLGAQGISASPEGAATWAGLIRLCDQGLVKPEDRVVLFNTSHAMKYLPWKPEHPAPIIRNYSDWLTLIDTE